MISYTLSIDTAVGKASICLSENGKLIGIDHSENQLDQASWIQVSIKKLLATNNIALTALNAVAVSIGPGSYTGLRIGLSTAKGLCYALNIPLITISTLEMMANAAGEVVTDLLCPMIDARRMEVFTAVYTKQSQIVVPPCAMIIDENSFRDLLDIHSVLFYGNGSMKFKTVSTHQNAFFDTIETDASHLITIATRRLSDKDFDNVAYSEPAYIKSFFTTNK